MTPTNTGATFYTETNYGGTSKFFEEQDAEYQLPEEENDIYKSVRVNSDSAVFAWQHYGDVGNQAEWTGDNPDITSIGGLSVFKVVPNSHVGIAMRLENGTGSSDILYCLYSQVHGSGAQIESYSNNLNYQIVGTINTSPGGEPIEASIKVRNMQEGDSNYGQYLNNGAVYFRTDSQGNVCVDKDSQEYKDFFPSNMDIEAAPNRANHFNLILTSADPA